MPASVAPTMVRKGLTMALNSVQINTFVKDSALEYVTLPAEAVQIDAYSYAIPVEVEGETRYAKLTLTACLAKDTAKNTAFNPETAAALYQAKLAERETKAAEKERAKAERLAAKLALKA